MARDALLVYANTRPWSDAPAACARDAWLASAMFPEPLTRQVADWGEQHEEYWAVVHPKPEQVASVTARLVRLDVTREPPNAAQSYVYGSPYSVQGDEVRTRVAVLFPVPPQEPFRPSQPGRQMVVHDWASTLNAAFPELWAGVVRAINATLKAQAVKCRAAVENEAAHASRGRSSDLARNLRTAHARLQALRRELDKTQLWATCATSGPKAITCWNMTLCSGNANEVQIVPPDVCTQLCKFPEWLGSACREDVGLGRLRPKPQIELTEWPKAVVALWHGMKVDLLLGQVFDSNIPKDRVLRGMVDPDERDVFWVVTSQRIAEFTGADGTAAAETAAVREEDTLKQHAAWICPLDVLREILELYESASSEEIFARAWSKGFLHVLRSAPRSRWTRWRIRLGKPAEFTGPAVMIVFAFIGMYENLYTMLRRVIQDAAEGCWPSAPFFELLALPLPELQRTSVLAAMTTGPNLQGLPAAIRQVLDAEQMDVLAAIGRSRRNLHFVEAFAGTGKSVLGRAVVMNFILHGPRDQLLLYVSSSRDLRDDVVISMTGVETARAVAPPKVVGRHAGKGVRFAFGVVQGRWPHSLWSSCTLYGGRRRWASPKCAFLRISRRGGPRGSQGRGSPKGLGGGGRDHLAGPPRRGRQWPPTHHGGGAAERKGPPGAG